MDVRVQELVSRCRDRVAEGLRGVYTYGPEGSTVVYARDDVEYAYTADRLSALLDRAEDIDRTLSEMGTEKEPLGAPQASIQVFEHGFVVLFVDGKHGVAVSVDRSVAPEISEFLDACEEVIDRP